MNWGSESNNASEIGKIWERFTPLERNFGELKEQLNSLDKKLDELVTKVKQPSESQEEAQKASRSATAYRTNVRKIKEEVEDHLSAIQLAKDWIENTRPTVALNIEFISTTKQTLEDKFADANTAIVSIHETKNKFEQELAETTELLEQNQNLAEKMSAAQDNIEEIDSLESKAAGIVKNVVTLHGRVKELRNEILGYELEDDDGETQRIEGIKDELEHSYNQLSTDFEEF